MALKDNLPRWVRRMLSPGSLALATHDSIDATFLELSSDLAAVDADTVLDTASTAGLDRWGLDLQENRLPDQSDDQYRTMLKAIKQGRAVNEDGIRYALDRWGLTYTLYEFGDLSAFWDNGFYDVDIATVPPLTIQIVFNDPFGGATPTSDQKLAAQIALSNAVRDANRVKARGVQIVAVVPTSLQ